MRSAIVSPGCYGPGQAYRDDRLIIRIGVVGLNERDVLGEIDQLRLEFGVTRCHRPRTFNRHALDVDSPPCVLPGRREAAMLTAALAHKGRLGPFESIQIQMKLQLVDSNAVGISPRQPLSGRNGARIRIELRVNRVRYSALAERLIVNC